MLKRSPSLRTLPSHWHFVSGSLEASDSGNIVRRALFELGEEVGLGIEDCDFQVCGRPVLVSLPARTSSQQSNETTLANHKNEKQQHICVHPVGFVLHQDSNWSPTLNWENSEYKWVPVDRIQEVAPCVPGLFNTFQSATSNAHDRELVQRQLNDRVHGAEELATFVAKDLAHWSVSEKLVRDDVLDIGFQLSISRPAMSPICNATTEILFQAGLHNESLSCSFTSHTSGNASNTLGNTSDPSGNASNTLGNTSHTSGNASNTLGNTSHTSGNASNTLGNTSHTSGNASNTLGNTSDPSGNATGTSRNASDSSGKASHTLENASDPSGNVSDRIKQAATEFVSKQHNVKLALHEQVDTVLKRELKKCVDEGKPLKVITCSRSSTVRAALLRIADVAKAMSVTFQVVVAESRPRCEGIQLASELSSAGIECEVITDAQVFVMAEQVKLGLIGADTICANGSIVNKVGSRALCTALKETKKPMYVIATTSKISGCPKLTSRVENPTQKEAEAATRNVAKETITVAERDWLRLPNPYGMVHEENSPSEIIDTLELGEVGDLSNVQFRNVYFESFSTQLVTGIITEVGVLDSKQTVELIQKHHDRFRALFWS